MSDLYSMAGWKFYIGEQTAPQKDDFAEADLSGGTFTEVDGWETMGAFGDAAQVITTSLLNRGRDVKQKGTRNSGSMDNRFSVLLGVDPDPGQTAMEDAEKTDDNYAFKVEAPDAPENGTPTTFYFVGLVASAQMQGGTANTIQILQASTEINSNIVRVDAASGV